MQSKIHRKSHDFRNFRTVLTVIKPAGTELVKTVVATAPGEFIFRFAD
jgi:hypothetical protein